MADSEVSECSGPARPARSRKMQVWLIVAILCMLAWTAEAIYCVYDPQIVYGVIEPSGDDSGVDLRYISDDCLEAFEPHIRQYATSVVRGFACGYIYGCSVGYEEIFLKSRTDEMKSVDRFAKKFNLGKPMFLPALLGDYEHCDETSSYYPVDKDYKKKHTKRKDDEDSVSSNNKSGQQDDSEHKETESTADVGVSGHHDTENGEQSEVPSTAVENQESLSPHLNQASFNKVYSASFHPHQNVATRIVSSSQRTTQETRPKICNAVPVSYLKARPFFQAGISLRQLQV